MDIYLDALKAGLSSHLKSLQNFDFSFFNPLFWIFLLILFLVLLRFWETKKSFSFCFTIGVVLLATTEMERYVTDLFTRPGETLDLFVIRISSLLLISVISLYYLFLKDV